LSIEKVNFCKTGDMLQAGTVTIQGLQPLQGKPFIGLG
jgi:hypothetical protein